MIFLRPLEWPGPSEVVVDETFVFFFSMKKKFSGRKLEMYVKSSKVGRGYRLDLPQDAGLWQMKVV